MGPRSLKEALYNLRMFNIFFSPGARNMRERVYNGKELTSNEGIVGPVYSLRRPLVGSTSL